MIEIPSDKLEPTTLRRVIEEFICREGTDYGPQEFTLEEKVEQIQGQLANGRARLVFDKASNSCTIIDSNS